MHVKERPATTPAVCAYSHLDYHTDQTLEGRDQGALEVGEEGWIGWCLCGWRTEVRYSPIAAQSAVAVHVIDRERSITVPAGAPVCTSSTFSRGYWISNACGNAHRSFYVAAWNEKAWWIKHTWSDDAHAWVRDDARSTVVGIMPTTYRTLDEANGVRVDLERRLERDLFVCEAATGVLVDQVAS